jgi:hypothetical protein
LDAWYAAIDQRITQWLVTEPNALIDALARRWGGFARSYVTN